MRFVGICTKFCFLTPQQLIFPEIRSYFQVLFPQEDTSETICDYQNSIIQEKSVFPEVISCDSYFLSIMKERKKNTEGQIHAWCHLTDH